MSGCVGTSINTIGQWGQAYLLCIPYPKNLIATEPEKQAQAARLATSTAAATRENAVGVIADLDRQIYDAEYKAQLQRTQARIYMRQTPPNRRRAKTSLQYAKNFEADVNRYEQQKMKVIQHQRQADMTATNQQVAATVGISMHHHKQLMKRSGAMDADHIADLHDDAEEAINQTAEASSAMAAPFVLTDYSLNNVSMDDDELERELQELLEEDTGSTPDAFADPSPVYPSVVTAQPGYQRLTAATAPQTSPVGRSGQQRMVATES